MGQSPAQLGFSHKNFECKIDRGNKKCDLSGLNNFLDPSKAKLHAIAIVDPTNMGLSPKGVPLASLTTLNKGYFLGKVGSDDRWDNTPIKRLIETVNSEIIILQPSTEFDFNGSILQWGDVADINVEDDGRVVMLIVYYSKIN
jgi:hypothetical protein